MGRRSPIGAWLTAIGAGRPAIEASETSSAYCSRFFQAPAGQRPLSLRAALVTLFDSYGLLTLPGDAGSWSVTIDAGPDRRDGP